MSKKVLVFGGSNSSTSINKRFATYAASQLTNTTNLIVDLRDFELPVFSVDIERTSGVPEKAIEFQKLIEESDAIVASFAANNGNFSSAFKNLRDWMYRIDTPKIWRDKPMFLLSA
ncbi:MAG: NAD(P)H-dependent oxidoreductase, partial [Bacteroidota bacterium]